MQIGHKTRKRILLIAVIPALVIVVLMGLLGGAVYDVLRPVRSIDIQEFMTKSPQYNANTASTTSVPLPSTRLSQAVMIDGAIRKTSVTLPAAVNIADLLPMDSFKSANVKAKVRAVNEQYAEWRTDFEIFLEKSGTLDDQERSRQRLALSEKRNKLEQALFSIHATNELDSKLYNECWNQVGGMTDELNRLDFGYYVKKQDWLRAQFVARGNMGDWELERAVLMHWPNGKTQIALRSFARNWTALKRSIPRFGGGFSLPHRQPGD